MSYLDDLLGEVRSQIEPNAAVLTEARGRLQLVRDSASSFTGALRTYQSGSLAVHTMNEPVTDGDGGLVLNRNYYPNLGPDGNGEAPTEVVEELIAHLRPKIRAKYPNASMHTSKRGPKIHFGEPVDGTNPTVDLVVAMNRKEGAGLWIPNLEKDIWEPSDPEKHAEILNGDSKSFRSTRRKVIRLAKAWNKQFSQPGASSFEMSVWAHEFVEMGQGVSKGLWTLFGRAAERLENGGATRDPAGVSKDLKLLIDAATMGQRLRKAATHLERALTSDNDDEIQEEMSLVFTKYISAPQTSALKASISLLSSKPVVKATALGVGVAASTGGAYRAFGGI